MELEINFMIESDRGASMNILTSREMRAIDRTAIDELGIPGPVLMENAGRRVADEILKRYPCFTDENVVIVAGRGNNGGDGVGAARCLGDRGARPVVLLLARKSEIKGEAALHLAVADRLGLEIVEIEDEARWNAIAQTEVCRRWWKHMRDLMPSHPDNSPVSKELAEVFHLD